VELFSGDKVTVLAHKDQVDKVAKLFSGWDLSITFDIFIDVSFPFPFIIREISKYWFISNFYTKIDGKLCKYYVDGGKI
jgi:hypothetical protein